MVSHVKNNFVEKFLCLHCKKKFKSNLVRYQQIHSSKTPFKHENCGKKFNQKYFDTFKNIKGQKNFQVLYIVKKNLIENNLVTYLKIHNSEKSLKCLQCKKEYKHKSTLSSHLRIPSDKKKFIISNLKILYKLYIPFRRLHV